MDRKHLRAIRFKIYLEGGKHFFIYFSLHGPKACAKI